MEGGFLKLSYDGIDWEGADLDRREVFGLDSGEIYEVSAGISSVPGVCGCVLLSTCNRTEIYLTTQEEYSYKPASLLCSELGVSYEENSSYFHHLEGGSVVQHLMEVSCGLRSQILGEDQIVAQVRNAIASAREVKSADGILQTLFRLAITAGKEVRSKVRLGGASLSVAERAVEQMRHSAGSLRGKRAVVIGNGEMGRIAAALLVEEGCLVTVTLRSYRHGATIIPEGCDTIPYDMRMEAIDGSDLLISATKSPHYTITKEQICGIKKPPALIADLSVPRDIEKTVGLLPKIRFWDMDSIKSGEEKSRQNAAALLEAQSIIKKHTGAFYKWWSFKNDLVHKRKEW